MWIEGGNVILELKVAPEIAPLHRAQAISYLKVTDADLALVVNFGATSLQVERLPNFVRDKPVSFTWEARPTTDELLYSQLTDQILQAMHRVHFTLGPGFLHQVYRRASLIELRTQGLQCDYIKEMPVIYQGQKLGTQAVRLIRVEGKLLVGAMAVKQIDAVMKGQLQARLRHLEAEVGLLANFHGTTLDVARV